MGRRRPRHLRSARRAPRTRLAAIGAPATSTSRGSFLPRSSRAGRGATAIGDPDAVDELVDELNRYRPEVLVSYASVVTALAEEQLQGRLAIEPRLTVTSSEVLTDEAGVLLEQAWGRQPVNVYAATEAPAMACGRVEEGGLSVAEDVLVLEVVDESGKHVPPGVPGAKVLLTNLVNRVQPLIRYELSDSVVIAGGPDPFGRPYLRIARVDGRSDDALTFAGADGSAVRVSPFRCGRRSRRWSTSSSTRSCRNGAARSASTSSRAEPPRTICSTAFAPRWSARSRRQESWLPESAFRSSTQSRARRVPAAKMKLVRSEAALP